MGTTMKNLAILARGYVYVSSRHRLYAKLPTDSRLTERGRYWVRYYWPAEVLRQYEERFPARAKADTAAPHKVDLLAAIFGVTRAAKRFRDAAASCYSRGVYSLAGVNRERKEHLYALKDRGIVAAVESGRLAAVGTRGVLTEYRGEGYCFHSLLRRRGVELSDLGTDEGGTQIFVEAKPRSAEEPRLKDCMATLAVLLEVRAGLDAGWEKRLFPPRQRERGWPDDDDWEDWL